eukprot:TRINITY_DN20126_c0_g1_i2.p1 TRINITY_DN20126_c0_g1~~TRINITY_DN20126_c0_g1_i2.p1  ORF type:complete len:623 (-),score=80.02 TRINITY_DN20126_c0_g1_i2:187-2004(-)
MVTRDSRIPTSTSARVIERTAVPYSHRLPEGMIWCIHIVVAVGMVGLNLLQIFSMKTIVDVKFDTMQYVIDRSNIWFGFVFLAIASMTSASICLGAIFCFAPAAGGSGVSENKAWLNGARETMGVFTWRNMIVRAIATTFSNASGFPVGNVGSSLLSSTIAFPMSCFQCLCSVLLCGITVPLGFYAAGKFIEKHGAYEQPILDEDGYLRTPQNMTPTMWFPNCTEANDLKARIEEFNACHEWKLVTYKSKKGPHSAQEIVDLTAWWLPANDSKAPRIVLQHGNNVNFNDWTVHVPAYYLRTMGFSVLLPNLRDHGSSGKTEHASIGWAWDYYLDVETAWEYLVNDPDGKLGGKIAKDKVGIYGNSMGGLASSVAFGHLKDAPALWLDSPVYHPKQVFEFQIGSGTHPFLGWASIAPAWFFANLRAGVDLDHVVPEDALKKSSRPVAVVQAKDDNTVPWTQAEEYIKYFKKMGYSVKEEFIVEKSNCGGTTHVSMHTVKAHSEEYYKRLCGFWSDAFGTKRSVCEGGLPREGVKSSRLYEVDEIYMQTSTGDVSPVPFAVPAGLLFGTVATFLLGARAIRTRFGTVSGAQAKTLVQSDLERSEIEE